jgi:hypothetical protein
MNRRFHNLTATWHRFVADKRWTFPVSSPRLFSPALSEVFQFDEGRGEEEADLFSLTRSRASRQCMRFSAGGRTDGRWPQPRTA